MSRNLCSTVCVECEHPIELCEEPRVATKNDMGRYFDEFEGMVVAKAKCPICLCNYLAWVDTSKCKKERQRQAPPLYGEITDLSYLSTFNDEPGESDGPVYEVQKVVTWHRIGRIQK